MFKIKPLQTDTAAECAPTDIRNDSSWKLKAGQVLTAAEQTAGHFLHAAWHHNMLVGSVFKDTHQVWAIIIKIGGGRYTHRITGSNPLLFIKIVVLYRSAEASIADATP